VLRGKIDGVLKYEDGTHTVIDFKTSEINENRFFICHD
jgi:ATP-dependent exoDNAse (exonuclease V) beta subunit